MTVDEQSLAWWRALPPMHITNWPLLPEYSATNPTGVTIGKRWRRHNGSFDQRFILQGGVPRWVICEYAEAPDEMQSRWDEKQGKYVRVPVQMAKTVMYRPVVRVKAPIRLLAHGIPDDAMPGDLVVGNRGSAARVTAVGAILTLEYIGNYNDGVRPDPGFRMYDRR